MTETLYFSRKNYGKYHNYNVGFCDKKRLFSAFIRIFLMRLMMSTSLTPISIVELAYREYSLYKDVEKIPLSSVLMLAIMPFLMN